MHVAKNLDNANRPRWLELTPTLLRIGGRAHRKPYWSVTLEVHAQTLLLRLGRCETPRGIQVYLMGIPTSFVAMEKSCFKSLFTPHDWQGSIERDGTEDILALLSGVVGDRAGLQLAFTKQVDDQQSLRIEGPADSFDVCACRQQAAHESSPDAACDLSDERSTFLAGVCLRLRSERINRHYSLQRMATLCGISKSTLGELERGKRKITLAHLYRIAAALNVTVADLVTP